MGMYLSHPHTFQVMQSPSGTFGVLENFIPEVWNLKSRNKYFSSVIQNLSNHDLKENGVLDTLIFIPEG